MNRRALGFLLPAVLICHSADSDAAAVASGRNWRISLERIQCEEAGSLLVIGTRVHYLGPKGPVEAPAQSYFSTWASMSSTPSRTRRGA